MDYSPFWLAPLGYVLLASGAVCFFAMKSQPVGRKRGVMKLTALLLMAAGALASGTDGVLFNERAPHLTVSGTVTDVSKRGGRSSSTSFNVVTEQGDIVGRLSLGGDWNEVNDMAWANVTYQAQSMRVLAVNLVSGTNSASRITGSDGMLGSVLAMVAGVACALYGLLNFLSDGTANDPEDIKPQPAGVDDESLLHLSRPGRE